MNTQQQSALETLVGRALTGSEVTALTPLVALRRDGGIAVILSVGRVHLVPTEVGNGTILEVLGLSAGNALMDLINSEVNFRHVKPLVEQGRLRLDTPLVRGTLQSLVPTLLTQAQASALMARAEVPNPVSVNAVSDALNLIGV